MSQEVEYIDSQFINADTPCGTCGHAFSMHAGWTLEIAQGVSVRVVGWDNKDAGIITDIAQLDGTYRFDGEGRCYFIDYNNKPTSPDPGVDCPCTRFEREFTQERML